MRVGVEDIVYLLRAVRVLSGIFPEGKIVDIEAVWREEKVIGDLIRIRSERVEVITEPQRLLYMLSSCSNLYMDDERDSIVVWCKNDKDDSTENKVWRILKDSVRFEKETPIYGVTDIVKSILLEETMANKVVAKLEEYVRTVADRLARQIVEDRTVLYIPAAAELLKMMQCHSGVISLAMQGWDVEELRIEANVRDPAVTMTAPNGERVTVSFEYKPVPEHVRMYVEKLLAMTRARIAETVTRLVNIKYCPVAQRAYANYPPSTAILVNAKYCL